MTLDELLQKLETFRGMEKGWDSYKADPPNDTSIANSQVFLKLCQEKDFLPQRVTPTCVGGVAMLWRDDGDKVFIEFYNSNKSCYLLDRGEGDFDVKYNNENEVTIEDMKSFLRERKDG